MMVDLDLAFCRILALKTHLASPSLDISKRSLKASSSSRSHSLVPVDVVSSTQNFTEHLALPLQKALYGMKQGRNEWRKTLYEFMTHKLKWICQDYDTAIFAKMWEDASWAIFPGTLKPSG
jgi:hypothetical protein